MTDIYSLHSVDTVQAEVKAIYRQVSSGMLSLSYVEPKLRELLVRRKVLHHTRWPSQSVKAATEAGVSAAEGLKLNLDAIPLWTLRQLLRRALEPSRVESILKGLHGGGRDEAACDAADRGSDRRVAEWDPVRIQRDIDRIEKVMLACPLSAGNVTRRAQLVMLAVKMKVALAAGKNATIEARQQAFQFAHATATDFDYSRETVAVSGLKDLLAPSTNRHAAILAKLVGKPITVTGPPQVSKMKKKYPHLIMPPSTVETVPIDYGDVPAPKTIAQAETKHKNIKVPAGALDAPKPAAAAAKPKRLVTL